MIFYIGDMIRITSLCGEIPLWYTDSTGIVANVIPAQKPLYWVEINKRLVVRNTTPVNFLGSELELLSHPESLEELLTSDSARVRRYAKWLQMDGYGKNSL